VLLLALVFLLAVSPLLRGLFAERVLFDALYTLVFAATFLVVASRRALLVPALLLGVPPLLGEWIGYALARLTRLALGVGLHLSAALFLAFSAAAVLWAVYGDASVSADSVYGAFCGYLLIGVAFGHVFCVLESLAPGSFRGGEGYAAQLRNEDRQRFL